MGQQAGSEAQCQDGCFSMCAPEDSQKNEPGNPNKSSPYENYRPPLPASAPTTAPPTGVINYGYDEPAFVPPPAPAEDRNQNVGPPREKTPSHAPQQSQRVEVTADDIISDLDKSEDVVYGEAFIGFPGGLSGFVPLDCHVMRDFICTNSSISMDDIDIELLKVASPDEGLSRDGFLHVLRDHAASETECIEHFLGLSADGDTAAAEECRNGLLGFATTQLHCNFSNERWDCIFNMVMWDAATTVPMEQWRGYCKMTARMCRLLRYAQV